MRSTYALRCFMSFTVKTISLISIASTLEEYTKSSSIQCERTGSSPASRTKETVERLSLFLSVDSR